MVDGRGVVSQPSGTNTGSLEGEEGYLKGYGNRKRRWWGDSGKAWFYSQKELEKKKQLISSENTKKGPRKPEETILIKWASPLKRSREYHFHWRGHFFLWKGTGILVPQHSGKRFKGLRSASTRWSHLKLVVVVPHLGEVEEVVLARYTSTMAKRKAGRLEIFEEAVDGFISSYGRFLSLGGSSTTDISEKEKGVDNEKNPFQDPSSPTRDLGDVRERLRDLVVASGMCMIIGEFEKREVLYAILLLLLEAAQNGGG